VERGMTNAALKSPDPLAADRRTEIAKLRTSPDQAFRDAVLRLRAVGELKAAGPRIDEAEGALRSVEDLRRKVDENLARPAAARDAEVVNGLVPALTGLIDVAANRLRITLETRTNPPSAALSRLVGVRHLAAEMAEKAGRERAILAAAVGSSSKLSVEELGRIAALRGNVELAWATIAPIAERADVPRDVAETIKGVEQEYFRTYGPLRDRILGAGAGGNYGIGANEYFASATKAINSILRLSDAIGTAADLEAADQAARSTSSLIIAGLMLTGSAVLAALSFWIALARIVRPLSALTRAMGELATGNFAVVLPGLDRNDEVGDMAHAVERFKVKAEQKARDEAEAKLRQDQIAAEQRKADMHRLADQF
jgi:HAMP domain-containing protein